MGAPRDHVITFAGAGEREIPGLGRFLRVIEATGQVTIRLEGSAGSSEITRRAGHQVDYGGIFKRVWIGSAIAQTVRVSVSDEPQQDDQETVNVNATATVDAANTLDAGGDVSVGAGLTVQVAAGDATRRALVVTNLDGNTTEVRVGGLGVGAAAGHPLLPGDSVTIATTAPVYVHNPHSGAQSVSVLPVRHV